MESTFINNTLLGKKEIWRFILTIFFVIIFHVIGILLTGFIAIALNDGIKPDSISDFISNNLNAYTSMAILNMPFILSLIALLLSVKIIHKRNWISLFNSKTKLIWNKLLFGALLFLILRLCQETITYFFYPDEFNFNLNPNTFFPLLLISLVIIPLQTSFEELFHRGYLLQTFAYFLKYPWIAIILTSIIFGLLHAGTHSEIEVISYFIIIGLILGIIVIVTNGLEVVLGMHAVQNLFSLIITDSNSKSSIFVSNAPDGGILGWLITPVVFLIIVILLYGTGKLKNLFIKKRS
ncbi:MAG: CPBP family intramembrane metalloprotease [Bacteroidales bacterium]|nr:CPBP family intramembrane metalloprotease [Bacteroidales bacterium]